MMDYAVNAQKDAQAAYIDSLQTMTPADLIKEVMRVQIAAADLINQMQAELDAAYKKIEELEA